MNCAIRRNANGCLTPRSSRRPQAFNTFSVRQASLPQLRFSNDKHVACNSATGDRDPQQLQPAIGPIGEDAAAFDVSKQSLNSWALFFGLLTGVLGMIYLVSVMPYCPLEKQT
jgi:hypothetical protein